MIQRGRQSAAQLEVATINGRAAGAVAARTERLEPSGNLSELERSIWVRTVNSVAAAHFSEEHIPLLEQYVRHVAAADLLNVQVSAFKPEWLKTAQGLRRYDALRRMVQRETTLIAALAKAMRITQNSAARGGGSSRPLRKPWEE